jgi:hypothetical protein
LEDAAKNLTLLIVALLPGALFVWAYEAQAGEWGIRRPDRLLRFVAASGVMQALAAPATFIVWKTYLRDHGRTAGDRLPWLFWLAIATYAAIPALLGYLAGRLFSPRPRVLRRLSQRRIRILRRLVALRLNLGVRRFAHRRRRRFVRRWLQRLTRTRPPRAWDYFFAKRPDGWIRIKLRDGPWIGGIYAEGSYASGYPHEPQDILLATVARVDPESGEFVRDRDGNVPTRDSGILIRWDEISYLEFIDG